MTVADRGGLITLGRERRLPRVTQRLRALLRESLPFAWRVGLRRLPAIIAAARETPPPRVADRQPWCHVQAERQSPLRRPGTEYDLRLQRAKEQNVRRAAAAVDGVVIPPGEVFSWHRTIGPPLRLRGFVAGPELHDGQLATGAGGGLCQVTNLVYYLALHAGMTIVERHRHHLDLFADANRDVPFGCGATVFYPDRDLRFRNPLDQTLLLDLRVADGMLRGQARLRRDPGERWQIVETDHRFVEHRDGIWRENRLVRRRTAGDADVTTEWIADNCARVMYRVPAEEISER